MTAASGTARPGAPVVLLAAGGTAGHVEPALAVADALRAVRPDVEPVVVGTGRGLETRLVPARGHRLETLPAFPLPRRPDVDLLRLPLRLVRAVRAARDLLRREPVVAAAGFGGYAALPVYLAAGSVPLLVHEANARPGLANRVGARRAAEVHAGVPGCPLPGAVWTGTPLRGRVAGLDRTAARAEAREALGLRPDGPVLLVTGGSQGARSINDAAVAAAPELAARGVQVLHVAGRAHGEAVRAAHDAAGTGTGPRPVVLDYADRMDRCYAAADVAVTRGGALTVAELDAVGLAAVVVPLPHGNGEQALNAAPLVERGLARVVADVDLDGPRLVEEVCGLLDAPAAARGTPGPSAGAADVLARRLLALGGLA